VDVTLQRAAAEDRIMNWTFWGLVLNLAGSIFLVFYIGEAYIREPTLGFKSVWWFVVGVVFYVAGMIFQMVGSCRR
jgi:hypothetical protein